MPESADGRHAYYSDLMRSFINKNLLRVRPGGFYDSRFPGYNSPRMRTWRPDVILDNVDDLTSGTLQLEAKIAGKEYVEIRPLHIYGFYKTREAARKQGYFDK